MKRKTEEIDTSALKNEIPELKESRVRIFIDIENKKNKQQIIDLLTTAGRKKLNTIFACILRCDYLDKIYKREAQGVTAIKFKGGASKNQNIRIYCKEIFDNGKKVVMVSSLVKKVSKNVSNEKILNIIEKIKRLEYQT
ncbi:MAG: hypothetical protein ACX93O_06325 [Flagellimonas sp.]